MSRHFAFNLVVMQSYEPGRDEQRIKLYQAVHTHYLHGQTIEREVNLNRSWLRGKVICSGSQYCQLIGVELSAERRPGSL